MIFMSQVTICFGIHSYTFNRNIETVLYYVTAAIFVFLFALMETLHQMFLAREPVKFNEALNTMSDEEFQMEVQKGRQKLVILDDLVLDVTNFANSHPGGRFLIERNIGKDISKYFHGGYSLEPLQKARNHKHSNYARLIVNDLIVARYVAKRGTSIMSIEPLGIDESKDVATFTFRPRGNLDLPSQMKGFYPDLSTVGKHYLVQQVTEAGKFLGQARQYTVAITMEPEIYTETINSLNSGSSDKLRQTIKSKQGIINLTVKNYKTGLSQVIREGSVQHSGHLFQVSGPIGRSLSIDTNGLNVIFAAGTGVLPFMDLIGFVARQSLGVEGIDGSSDKLGKGFHLWMCTRMNPNEPIGHELLSALESNKADWFKYDQVTKEVQAERWSTELIARKLSQISSA